jgi:alpha-tubulin suppressor-like RCC1 family protein
MLRAVAWVMAVAGAGALATSCAEGPSRAPTLPIFEERGADRWLAVTTGRDHSCGIDVDRRAYWWGSNAAGQLGVPETKVDCGTVEDPRPCSLVPMPIAAGGRWTMLSAGESHTCGVTTDGAAYCWGNDEHGQLGAPGTDRWQPVQIASATPFRSVAAGFEHSCGVTTANTVLCWGRNARGELGDSVVRDASPPRVVNPGTEYVDVSVSQQRTCARRITGQVDCWGAIWVYREGGAEFRRAQPTPEVVPSSPAMAILSVGTFATCGVDASGFGYCWEANPNGQHGDGTTEGDTVPRRMASREIWTQMSVGLLHACGVTEERKGFCWGDDTFGELGAGPGRVAERCAGQGLLCATRPLAVFGQSEWTMISASSGNHTCGITTRGNLYCWGLGTSGQLGEGTRTSRQTVPVRVVGKGSIQ